MVSVLSECAAPPRRQAAAAQRKRRHNTSPASQKKLRDYSQLRARGDADVRPISAAVVSRRRFSMVCIPCIVIPVLLWVYKRFLEPVISPLITPLIPPFISRFWTKAAVQDTGGDVKEEHEKRSPAESNGVAHGSTANGPKTVADKKAD